MPALVHHSLPAQLIVSPNPLEGLPVLKPSCLSSYPPHQPIPTLSSITPLPEHPASLDHFQSVQQSVPQTITLSNLPQAFVDHHPPTSVFSHPPPCHSPSSSLSSSSTSISSSSSSIQFPSSSSVFSSPSPSTSTSPFLPLSFIPLFSSPLHSSPSLYLPPTNLDFPPLIPPVSSSFMISSSHASLFLSFYLPISFYSYPFLQSSSRIESREEKRSKWSREERNREEKFDR